MAIMDFKVGRAVPCAPFSIQSVHRRRPRDWPPYLHNVIMRIAGRFGYELTYSHPLAYSYGLVTIL
jgi:hypothetical protein